MQLDSIKNQAVGAPVWSWEWGEVLAERWEAKEEGLERVSRGWQLHPERRLDSALDVPG